MPNTSRPAFFTILVFLLLILSHSGPHSSFSFAEEKSNLTADQSEFFENHIRPVLAKHCYECHNSGEEPDGNLILDFRGGLLKGGVSGPVLNLNNPLKSLLLQVMSHEIEDLEMPQGGERLDDETIALFTKWIEMGAPDPRDEPPSDQQIANATSWETVREKRKEWWSFQPIQSPPIPVINNNNWSHHPVDQFILEKLNEHQLTPSETADCRTLIRRVTFTLTGLPPTQQEIAHFLNDQRSDAYARLVDRLLASKHFGERWARHWMDWVRYTETHGSEGDPAIPFAYRYRDYLIRALNADIPYDQLLREHVAGDLLPNPRINSELGLNESTLATAHWRMVFHGFAPTDPLDEKVRFTDDQINVFSKAFLGLTVSCARCHDHKFDAISQKDYYALFGILGSNRPAVLDANTQEKQNHNKPELALLKKDLKEKLADIWLKSAQNFPQQLLSPSEELQQRINKSDKPVHFLNLWKVLNQPEQTQQVFNDNWGNHLTAWKKEHKEYHDHQKRDYFRRWDLSNPKDYQTWFADGNGLSSNPSAAGEFHLLNEGEKVIDGIYPAGVYSHSLSTKHRAVLSSPRIQLEGDYEVAYRIAGNGNAIGRHVVQHYPRNGTVYPFHRMLDPSWKIKKYNLDYWNGDNIHLEFSTSFDQPALPTRKSLRSWFGIREAVLFKKGTPAPPVYQLEFLAPLYQQANQQAPQSPRQLAQWYQQALVSAISAWKENTLSDSQALFLNAALAENVLPNRLVQLPTLRKNIASFRQLESEVPYPTRIAGTLEAVIRDQPLMVRGDHKNLAEPVPRRFLEAIDTKPYQSTTNSGRIELAEDLLRADNPFTSRVIVNRLWHYIFGNGLVRTTDNFGRLGDQPTHPELLDHLATRFVQQGWSLKETIRYLVTSKAYQQNSSPSPKALNSDPANNLLSHAKVQRLEAEAIRDSLLAVSQQLDTTLFGTGTQPNSEATRRSIYITNRRNQLDQFLHAFDAPVPFSTKGRRDITNVPAQSLTLLNDKYVIQLARQWAQSLNNVPENSRITTMFEQAFGRQPTNAEFSNSTQFLKTLNKQHETTRTQHTTLQKRLNQLQATRQNILEPAREKILLARNAATKPTLPGPQPISLWNFDEGFKDSVGSLHGEPQDDARIENGALVVNGSSYVKTVPLQQDLQEKTLEVWVQLNNLNQQGGGVISVQDLRGDQFDSIVFAERIPKRWYAGSNNGLRSLPFNGQDEQEAHFTPVHVAIVYHQDGTIQGYRNGKPYGKPYRKAALATFHANDSQILFGLRHGAPGGNRLLKGRLFEARLYNRALTAEEINASATSDTSFVSQQDLLDSLTIQQRTAIDSINEELSQITKQIASLRPIPDKNQAWADLAHALFNLKNFIYVY